MANYSKRDARREEIIRSVRERLGQPAPPKPPPPPKRARAPAGPVPTLAETARMFAWCWVTCALPCGHHAAVPLDRAIARLGADADSDDLCRRMVCTVCGRRRATLRLPSVDVVHARDAAPPADAIALGFR